MIEITRHGAEIVSELRPFWLAMVAHHARVAPEMGPVRDDEDTWARRRAHYERQLARPGAFALLARLGGSAVGYAVVTGRRPPRPGATPTAGPRSTRSRCCPTRAARVSARR